MGLMVADVVFNDRTPPLSDICAAVTAICSLPITVLQSEVDDLHDLDATIAFECAKDVTLQLVAYRDGAAARFCDDMFPHPAHSSFMKHIVQDAHEPAGTQTVHLRGYVGQEPTLMVTTELALESLGGTLSHAMADATRCEYGRRITAAELTARRRKIECQMQRLTLTTILMLPILIPLSAVGWLWFIVTMPFRIWRGSRILKAIEGGSGETE